jgi:hypothetical protein
MDLERIPVDCFYEGKNVKDKNSNLFRKFSKHILEEVKGMFVIAALKRGLVYNEVVETKDGSKCVRTRQVNKALDIATVFCQIPTETLRRNLNFYQNKLYDVLYEDFGANWEIPIEDKVMKDLGYRYYEAVSEFKELGIRKGDVAKLITTKYREEKTYIMDKIEAVHGRGTLNISRRRVNGASVDGGLVRGGRNKRKFYTGLCARKVRKFTEQYYTN